MKRKLIITQLIIILSCAFAFGQKTDVEKRVAARKAGDYISATNIHDFDGTWIWKEGGSEFKLILAAKLKQPQHAASNQYYYIDLIYGACVYIKNGKEVLNTVDDINSRPNFVGIVYKENELKIMLEHVKPYIGGKEISPYGVLQLNSDKKSITWMLKIEADVDDPNYLLPKEIILTKI